MDSSAKSDNGVPTGSQHEGEHVHEHAEHHEHTHEGEHHEHHAEHHGHTHEGEHHGHEHGEHHEHEHGGEHHGHEHGEHHGHEHEGEHHGHEHGEHHGHEHEGEHHGHEHEGGHEHEHGEHDGRDREEHHGQEHPKKTRKSGAAEQLLVTLSKAEKVCVFVDGSEPADQAFGMALRFKHPEDELIVVYVASTINTWSPGTRFALLPRDLVEDANKATCKVGKQIAKAYLKAAHQRNIQNCQMHVLAREPMMTESMQAVDFLKHNHITQAFVGARGQSQLTIPQKEDRLLGSFSHYLLEHAPCSVSVVRS